MQLTAPGAVHYFFRFVLFHCNASPVGLLLLIAANQFKFLLQEGGEEANKEIEKFTEHSD